jgi:hypothetical protein
MINPKTPPQKKFFCQKGDFDKSTPLFDKSTFEIQAIF